MNPYEMLEHVNSPQDLSKFAKALEQHLIKSPDEWENHNLADYLEAMSAWLESANSEDSPIHHLVAGQPSWRMFAQILLAASAYE